MCLGKTHVAMGTATFVGTTLAYSYTVNQMITGMVIVSCAALLPDFDHPRATASNAYGPITKGFSHLVAGLAGGHRKGTHCLLGIALLGVLAQVCVDHRHHMIYDGILTALLIVTLAAGVKILKIPGWIDELIPIPLAITLVFLTDINLDAVPPAIMLGCLVHVLGDCLTNSGCPIFHPFSKWRLKFGLFSTGGRFERWVVYPMMILGTIAMVLVRVFHGA
jgi:membrane-bound metal-dependent hydrolase YbcI (DUF457 family)